MDHRACVRHHLLQFATFLQHADLLQGADEFAADEEYGEI